MLSKRTALAAKEVGVLLLLLWITLSKLGVEQTTLYLALTIFALAYTAWKVGHTAHNGWTAIEHHHHVAEEERWEGGEGALPSIAHPLQEAAEVTLGSLAAMAICTLGVALWPPFGMEGSALLLVSAGSTLGAIRDGNRIFPTLIWNLALTGWSAGLCLFTLEYIIG